MGQRVKAGPDHLRLASNGIRVLDSFAVDMRIANFTASHQIPEQSRDSYLSRLAAKLVNAVVEWRVAALDRVG